MWHSRRLLAICFALAAQPVSAAGEQVTRGPVPKWVRVSELMPVPADATGMVFVRRQDSLTRLDASGQDEYSGYQIRILHPNALQAGNVAISWDPGSGSPIVHAVRVHRGAEVIDVLEQTAFEILRREDRLEGASLDGILTATLRVPDLRVGDDLEIAVTTRSQSPVLGDMSAGVMVLAPDPSPGRFHLGLSWTDGQEPKVMMTDDMAAVARKGSGELSFLFDNPSLLVLPKDAPPRFNWKRAVEFSDFADWQAVSRRFTPLFRAAATIPPSSPLQKEVARIAAAYTAPRERASAALKLVQRDVRYVYVGLAGGNLRPASAEETWQRRYGDCKGKTALLLGLLAGLGIEAEAILASNAGIDDGLDQRLPSPGMFDHVLVRMRLDGKTYYLDGTMPPVAEASETALFPYRWILPLSELGADIEWVGWKPSSRPDELSLYEIDARAGFDRPARITHTAITRGLKGLEQQVRLSAVPAGQLRESLGPQMIGGTWQAIDEVKWRYDEAAQASVLTIVGTGAVNWDDDGDGRRSLALPGGGFSPPERRARAAGAEQGLPYYNAPEFTCHVTTVRLPEATRPEQWSFRSGYDMRMFGRNYYRAFDLRDGTIRMVRGLRVEKREIEAASAAKDNLRIAGFDNSMGWINYDPSDRNVLAATRPHVPTTFDIDWTADKVPCLAEATLR